MRGPLKLGIESQLSVEPGHRHLMDLPVFGIFQRVRTDQQQMAVRRLTLRTYSALNI